MKIIKNGTKILSLFFVLIVVSLSGCINSSNNQNPDTISPTPTVTDTEGQIVTDTPISDETPESTDTGLTYEQEIAINPPPPRNLSGVFKTDHIELTWDAPETVTLPHNYSDKIESYKIYKGTSEEDMTYMTSTSALTFIDDDVPGPVYVYEVTAVHKDDVESVPSEDVIVET